MGEIILNGMDRSNSNENGVPNAASLIINARKKGSSWEYVGDKIHAGYVTGGAKYSGYYWHHKFSNNLVIGYNSDTRKVDVIDISKLTSQVRKKFIHATGTGDFTLTAEETFMSIYSLNDIIIIDTDKNKYYFVWNEEKENFEALPDLPDLSIKASYSKEKRLISTNPNLSITTTFSLNTADDSAKADFLVKSESLVTAYDNYIKDLIISSGCVWKGFRIVAAFELSDGTIVKTSNIIPFIDRLFVYAERPDRYLLYLSFGYETENNLLRLYFSTVYNNEKSPSDSPSEVYVYRNLKVLFSSNIYDVLDKWIENDLISNISIYITNPDTFLDVNNRRVALYNINYHGNYDKTGFTSRVYVGYNNDAAYNANVPYYKIGELNLKSKETEFEIKPEMLKNVINNKVLSVSQDLSRKYVSKTNMVYNGMLHKSCVKNLIDSKNLVYGSLTTKSATSSVVCIDVQINNKWIRIGLPANRSYGTSNRITLKMPNAQFFSPSIQQANLILRDYNTLTPRIFKKLKLEKSTHTNSLYVFPIIDFGKDSVDPNPTMYDHSKYKEYEAYYSDFFPNNPDKQFNIYDFSVGDSGLQFEVLESDLLKCPKVDYAIADDISYEDTNRLQLSATNNPFIYPAERSYRFGSENNKVIASESSTVQLSDSKFGQLPLYVFSKQGIWVMETAQGDIAYNSSHLIDNLECYDNPKLIQRVLGGVVFGAVNGIYVISNTTLKRLSQGLDGRIVPRDVEGIEQRISGLNITQACTRIDDLMKDYFSDNSFCVFDKKENELLFIEPDKDFSFVLQLDDMSWTTRKDGHRNAIVNGSTIYTNGTISQFTDSIIIDNEYRLIGRDSILNRDLFFYIGETDRSKTAGWNYINNNAVIFISGVIMHNQYVKLEHIISRFSQMTDSDFDSHILLVGSRDGIEWKVLNHSAMTAVPVSRSGQEMRRCFTSARYFQIVYIRIERNTQNMENRKQSYFERFSFDMSNSDSVGKLR